MLGLVAGPGPIETAARVGLTRSVTVRVMSECQSYEFAPVDCAIGPDELADMRVLSTLARMGGPRS